jgi:hypothetical protein
MEDSSSFHVVYVEFPNVPEGAFSDYESNDLVEVTGTAGDKNPTPLASQLVLAGKKIVRLGNRLSLVTDAGRAVAPVDYEPQRRQWEAVRQKPQDYVGRPVPVNGRYAGVIGNDSSCIIRIDRLFGNYGTLELTGKDVPGSAMQFLEQLPKGTEVDFEVTVLSVKSYSPDFRLDWVARVDDPTTKAVLQGK